jgi:hypothetical protein
VALEQFFEEVHRVIFNDATLQDVLKKQLSNDKKVWKDVLSDMPKMTNINRALANSQIKVAIWKAMDIPSDTNFPHSKLPSQLLYGFLSSAIHGINEQMIYVSDETPTDYKEFFNFLSIFFNKRYEEYDSMFIKESSLD